MVAAGLHRHHGAAGHRRPAPGLSPDQLGGARYRGRRTAPIAAMTDAAVPPPPGSDRPRVPRRTYGAGAQLARCRAATAAGVNRSPSPTRCRTGAVSGGLQRVPVPMAVGAPRRPGDPAQRFERATRGTGHHDGGAHGRRWCRRSPPMPPRPGPAWDRTMPLQHRAAVRRQPSGRCRRRRREHQQPAVRVGPHRPAELRHPRRVRRRDRHHARGPGSGYMHRGVEGQHTAVALADQRRLPFAERTDQPGDVGGQGEGVVAARRLVRLAGAAQIRRDDVESGRRELGELVSPVQPRCRRSRAADSTSGPVPASARWNRMPLALTDR